MSLCMLELVPLSLEKAIFAKSTFGKSNLLLEKAIYFWQKQFTFGKSNLLLAKEIYFWQKKFTFGKRNLLLAKVVHFW